MALFFSKLIQSARANPSSLPKSKNDFQMTCRLSNHKSKLYHILRCALCKLQEQTAHTRNKKTTYFVVLNLSPLNYCLTQFVVLQAEKFDCSVNPVVAVKGARLSDFGGRSVSALFSSTVMVNPDLPEAFSLRAWWVTLLFTHSPTLTHQHNHKHTIVHGHPTTSTTQDRLHVDKGHQILIVFSCLCTVCEIY